MKLIIVSVSFYFLIAWHNKACGQEKKSAHERFGRTINMGLGLGYYGYVPGAIPAFNINYEFDIAEMITLGPFVTAFTYSDYYYWGDNTHAYREYSYKRTVVPIGAKATYYFDELLNAGSKWDFYAAGSVGVSIVSTSSYEDGYGGDKSTYNGISPFYIDAHLGSEWHFSKTLGLYIDLSTGISTFGVAVHL